MFLLLKAKLRWALRITVCCFPILLPLDFLADVQGKMFLPRVATLPHALAAEWVHQEPPWHQWCHPAIARLEVPSMSCMEAMMLCTEPGTVVTISLIINPSHPSFRGLAGTHVGQCCALHPCSQHSWKQPWWWIWTLAARSALFPRSRRFPAVLRHLLS